MNTEYIINTNDDLMVANTARTSFDKWNTKLDLTPNLKGVPKDVALINYLAAHKHISPFFHVRLTFEFTDPNHFPIYNIKDPSLLMGCVWETTTTNSLIVQHSYYGWVNLIKHGYLRDSNLLDHLSSFDSLQYSNEAFIIKPLPTEVPRKNYVLHLDNVEYEDTLHPYFTNFSLRITCPIPIARQMFTHRMFASNEVSRRYVSTKPSFYTPASWRTKPEGSIKQGSGDLVISDLNLTLGTSQGSYNYTNILDISSAWYENALLQGLAPEQARFALPQAMETTFIFTGSAISWARLIINRKDAHAQKEVQYLADQIYEEICKQQPEFSYLLNLVIT